MKSRPLDVIESRNLVALNSSGCNSVLLFITATGLDKSILDATDPMRRLLQREGIHDFSLQGQGQENKVVRPAIVLGSVSNDQTSVSLYRPKTKNGDPRLWFSEFKRFAKANDVCAVFVHKSTIHLLNLTRSSVAQDLEFGIQSYTAQFIQDVKSITNSSAIELLGILKELAAKGPIAGCVVGDTDIGRSIETALGIKMNSSKTPDYKGIEIKAGRSKLIGADTRANLFACVADWRLSNQKSSHDIMARYGYKRGADFKLYCTVSTLSPNSQGLQLSIDNANNWLREVFKGTAQEEVCIWELDTLHKNLAVKHNETFWIKAKSISTKVGEFYELQSVTHTSKPSFEQFDRLLDDGGITLDHLIKAKPKKPKEGDTEPKYYRGKDKGPLFKIERPRIAELFLGQPFTYPLI